MVLLRLLFLTQKSLLSVSMFVSWVVLLLAEIGFVVGCGGVKLAISLEGFLFFIFLLRPWQHVSLGLASAVQ